jgi:hypothetical protein
MAGDTKAHEIRDLIEEDDLVTALDVIRDGLKSTKRTRAKAPEDSDQKYEYQEVPDSGVRLQCAKILLEYGFGKPHTRQSIEINDNRMLAVSPQEIASRLASSGADLQLIAKSYVEGLDYVDNEVEKPLQIDNAPLPAKRGGP